MDRQQRALLLGGAAVGLAVLGLAAAGVWEAGRTYADEPDDSTSLLLLTGTGLFFAGLALVLRSGRVQRVVLRRALVPVAVLEFVIGLPAERLAHFRTLSALTLLAAAALAVSDRLRAAGASSPALLAGTARRQEPDRDPEGSGVP